MTQILSPSIENYTKVKEALDHSEVVGIPTETVYGLAANATNEEAISNVFTVKERPIFDPLIVHIKKSTDPYLYLTNSGLIDPEKINQKQLNTVQILVQKYWPGPLTILFPKSPLIPDLCTSGLQTVAIRMPNHPIALQLLDYLSYPLAAPSANIFGRVSPTEASAVVKELGGRILYVLDGGSCEVGLESTVIRIDEVGKVIILRPGAVTKEMLEQTIGSGNVGYEDPNKPQNPTAPGMTDNHYAPRTPLFVLPFRMEDLADPEKKEAVVKLILKAMAMLQIKESFKVGLLCMKGDPEWNASFFKQLLLPLFKDGAIPQYRLEIGTLSVKGDLNESARNLFSEFRRMDEIGLKVVFSEPLFDKRGIGFAIADRLNKASIKMT